MNLHREYPHLMFRKHWEINEKSAFLLGQCDAFVKAINNTPIIPKHYKELMMVALIKGAQATTAIEGNTLSDEEIKKLLDGQNLPPSKEYQEIEVKNIIEALNELLNEVVEQDIEQFITPDLILRIHKMVGKDLGDYFSAIPGKFRQNDVIVGKYRCPDYRDIIPLVNNFCDWLKIEFGFKDKQQVFSEIVIQAIISHVYIEWIHPFSDGNGRTGRLIEFYILLRGNYPNIASHVLSNHYNLTRTEYYRQLDKATHSKDLTEFIEYALLGFRDGLENILSLIQRSQRENCWQKYIYEKFNEVKIVKKEVLKRKRTLALELPLDKEITVSKVPESSLKLARLYANISERTILRDLEELVKLEILIKDKNLYKSNIQILTQMMAKSRNKKIGK